MGDAYIRLRKYNDAIEVLQKHLEIAKPEDVIYEAIGHCYEKMRKYTQARYYYRKAVHLSPGDDKLYLKIAKCYMTEENWEHAVRALQSALRINKQSAEYNMTLGQCYIQLGMEKEALTYFLNAVRLRPSNTSAWKEFIRGLYLAGHTEEAMVQLDNAEAKVGRKPVFLYYRAAILIAMGRTKDGLLHLENALQLFPRQVKRFLELDPSILQHPIIVELIARYRRKR